MFRLLDEIIEDKNIAGVEAAAQGIFGVSAKTCLFHKRPLSLACHKVRLSTLLMLQTVALKSKENLELLGLCQRSFCSILTDGNPVEKTTRPMRLVRLDQRLHRSRWHRENTGRLPLLPSHGRKPRSNV